MTDILIKELQPGCTPKKALSTDKCYDVWAAWIEQKKDLITIGLGFATEMPEYMKGCIVPRSSVTKFKVVQQNSPSQIDPDYRGEWIVKFRIINRTFFQWLFGIYPNPFKIGGTAVAQIYFEIETPVIFKMTNELRDSLRGTGGFGHTNNKFKTTILQ